MDIRTLGKTNYKVVSVGFGGIPIQRLSEKEAVNLVSMARNEGMNFIDTARGYGKSEGFIGKGIEGHREDWIIATKSMARDYEGMKKDIEISLKNLNCGYIDLYQAHNVSSIEQYNEIMGENGAYKALKEAVYEGKVRHIGITGHDLSVLENAVEADCFSTIQFPYNAIETQAEDLFKRSKERNIGVIVMKPMAGGVIPRGDLALKFILENTNVSVVIPGVDSAEQVIENAAAAKSLVPLTEKERQELKDLVEKLGTEFCRRCGYCLPCPQGIDIPNVFSIERYYTMYSLEEWATKRYATLPQKASDCIECGACETKCPYNLPIRKMLKNVAKKLG